MKKITLSDVKKQILEGVAEFEEKGVDYYLHVTEDGEIVSDVSHADETFIFSVPYERYGFEDISDELYYEIQTTIYGHEVDGDDIFEEIAKNLCTQANKWLEEQGE